MALIACGIAWRFFKPLGIDADDSRRTLTGLVYVLLLPALVLQVLWKAPIGLDTLRITLVAGTCIIAALFLGWIIFHRTQLKKTTIGAMLLAAAFPNATYMGFPVLQELLGSEASSIALQYDLLACTPLLLTVGVLVARSYGQHDDHGSIFISLLKVPPLWAAFIAIALNISGVHIPDGLDHWLGMLGGAVIPLMLISLGMSLQWSTLHPKHLPALAPALIIQLTVTPLIAVLLSRWIGLQGDYFTGTVLVAAMPSMVLGLVLCDRYSLNTPLYAAAVTLSTLLSLLTIPFWFNYLS